MARKPKLSPKDMSRIAGKIVERAMPTIDFSLHITKADYARRWKQVQAAMKEKGYDLLYACGSELDRTDAAWLASVFDPIIERYAVMLPAKGKPVVLCGSEGGHVIQEATDNSGADIALLREFQISDEEYRHAKFRKLSSVVRSLRVGRTPKVCIASNGEFLPHDQYAMLCDSFGRKNLVFDELLMQRIKYVKSLKELRIMQEANKATDAAFRAMLAVCVPGVTETAVAGVGDFVMRQLGANRYGFPTIVTSGSRNYTVIGPAVDKVIENGDVVSMGLSPTWHGYHGICRRTVRAGKNFTPGQRAFIKAVEGLYCTVWDAVEKAAAGNLPAKTIDQAGKRYLTRTKVPNVKGKPTGVKEPYSFVHNTGCSECQEGFGAVTGWFDDPMGKRVALMIDCALLGFEVHGQPIFDCVYGVVEDAFWKNGRKAGVYNRMPINVQHLVGNEKPITKKDQNPYYRPLE